MLLTAAGWLPCSVVTVVFRLVHTGEIPVQRRKRAPVWRNEWLDPMFSGDGSCMKACRMSNAPVLDYLRGPVVYRMTTVLYFMDTRFPEH